MSVKAVIPLPDDPFYLWQMLVQATAFEKQGVDPTYLVYYDKRESGYLQAIRHHTDYTIRSYQDPRGTAFGERIYGPAMKPMLMGMAAVEASDVLPKERYLYLDPDVVLTRPLDELPSGWHCSDTDSYTGPGYLKSKGGNLWEWLCDLCNVGPSHAELYRGVGAQYVCWGDEAPAMWFQIAQRSVEAWKHMAKNARSFWPEGDEHPVQAWCAEMYITQLTAIQHLEQPYADPNMGFIWAGGHVDEWDDPKMMFFHDAGVPDPNGRDFCKGKHQRSPFGRRIEVSRESASLPYVEMIKDTEARWPQLIKEVF